VLSLQALSQCLRDQGHVATMQRKEEECRTQSLEARIARRSN